MQAAPYFSAMNPTHTRILAWYALIGIPLAFVLAVWGLSGLTAHYILAAESIAQTGKEAQGTLSQLTTATNGLNTTLAKINQPCIAVKGQVLKITDEKDCGTLADLNQTLRTVRGTVGLIEAQELTENGKIDDFIDTTADDLHSTLQSATATLDSTKRLGDAATTDLTELQPSITAASHVLNHADDTISDLDGVLKDAAIKQTLLNIQATTANVAGVTDSLNKMGQHLEKQVDKPCHAGCKVGQVFMTAAKVAVPITIAATK